MIIYYLSKCEINIKSQLDNPDGGHLEEGGFGGCYTWETCIS